MIINDSTITPIVKWCGGKRYIINSIVSHIPRYYGTYYEPFVGGGALLCRIQPQKAVLGDINLQLINMYRQIQENPKSVILEVNKLDSNVLTADLYYTLRDEYNDQIRDSILNVRNASLFIWLNKHCFNGLYRVNKKGMFNVPFNKSCKNIRSINEKNILNLHEYLQNKIISCNDYTETCETAKAGDLVYLDPPYLNTFDSYTNQKFGLSQHKQLKMFVDELHDTGCFVIISNNNDPEILDLYKEYRIKKLINVRKVNRDASNRMGVDTLIMNFRIYQ